ncbi:hypothetical protein OG524_01905 [Streptomyces sp. NBC_01520]|uniref:hypothetical protein n=1 Tax=Streptomyces sp. NBC_01520 TaxID=2903892 RepID=UPI0038692134
MRSWSLDDMPDLSGTTAVVTGANSGIGGVTAPPHGGGPSAGVPCLGAEPPRRLPAP